MEKNSSVKNNSIDNDADLLAIEYSLKYGLPKDLFLRKAYLEVCKKN